MADPFQDDALSPALSERQLDNDLRQFLASPPEDADQQLLDQVRPFLVDDNADDTPVNIPALALQASSEDPPTQPNLPAPRLAETRKNDARGFEHPRPRTFREGIAQFAPYGIYFDERDNAVGDMLERYADILTNRYLTVRGLKGAANTRSPELTDEIWGDVRGSFLESLMSTYRTPSNEERVELQKELSGRLLRQVQQTAMLQIRAAGDNTAVTQRWQEVFSKARGFESRLDEPIILATTMNWASRRLDEAKRAKSHLADREQAELGLGGELLRFADFSDDPQFERVRYGEKGLEVGLRFQQTNLNLSRLLDEGLREAGEPLAPARFIGQLANGLIAQLRARQDFGLPLEEAAQLGSVELMHIRHPDTAAKVDTAAARAQVRRELRQESFDAPAGRFEAELEKRIREHPEKIVESHMFRSTHVGAPLLKAVENATFDPNYASGPGFGGLLTAAGKVVKEGAFNVSQGVIGMAYRGARNAIDTAFRNGPFRGGQPTFYDPAGKLRRYADLTVTELKAAQDDPDMLEKISESHTSPILASLNRDLQSGDISYGTLMAVMNPKNDPRVAFALLEEHRFFPIAADLIRRMGAAGFQFEEMQKEWQATKRVLVEGVRGDKDFGTDQDVEKKLAAYSNEVRGLNPLSPVSEGFTEPLELLSALRVTKVGYKALSYAAAQATNFYRTLARSFDEDPSGFEAAIVTEFVIGDAAINATIKAGGAVVKPVLDSLQVAQKTAKVADGLAAVATYDARAVRRLQKQVKKLKLGGSSEAYVAKLDIVDDALDTIDVLHQSDRLSITKNRQASAGVKGLHRPMTQLKRGLRNLSESHVMSLADEVRLTTDMLSEPHLLDKVPWIPLMGRKLKEMFHLSGTPLNAAVLENADDIWRNIKRAVEDGTVKSLKAEDAINLISMRAASESRGATTVFFRKLKEAIFQKYGRNAVLTDDGFITDLLDFFGAARERLHLFRQVAGEKRAEAAEFLAHMDRSVRRRQRFSADPAPYDQMLTTLKRARDHSENIHFTRALKFDEHPLMDFVTVDDVISWTATHEGAGNTLFRRMAKAGELESEFYERLAALRGTPDEQAFLKSFAREYLNAPSINRKFAVDPYSGRIVTPKLAGKLRRERQAVADLHQKRLNLEALRGQHQNELQAAQGSASGRRIVQRRQEIDRLTRQVRALEKQERILQAAAGKGDLPTKTFLDELAKDPDVGFRRMGYGRAADDWDLVEGYAAAADAADMKGTLIRYQDMTNHDPLQSLSAIRAAHEETAIRIGGLQRRRELLWNAYEAASPKVRKAFDDALRAQEKAGDFAPLIELRRRNPELFKHMNPNMDEAVEFMLQESKTLRHALIDELEDVGWFRNADEANRWRAPWTSQQWREFVDIEHLDVIVGPRRPGPAGLTGHEFIARREAKDWKLLVARRNAATEELRFPSAEAAEGYVRRELGIQGDRLRKVEGDLRGRTALGDDFTIMRPLGENFLDVMRELPPGLATLERLEDLLEQAAVARTAKVVDLPGLRLTEGQVTRLKETLDGRRLLENYVHISPDDRRFGVLKGRWVHHKALRTLTDSELGASLIKELGREMRSSAMLHERLFNNQFGNVMYEAFAVPIRAIGANAIFRRLRTWQKNNLSNFGIFGPLATGGHHKFYFGKNAAEGHRIARTIAFGDPVEVNKLIRENPAAAAVFEHNVLDDTLGHGLIKRRSHRVMRRVLFGDDPSDIVNSPQGWRQALGKIFGRRSGERLSTANSLLEKLNPLSQSKAVRGLADELDRINVLERSGKIAKLTETQQAAMARRKSIILRKLNQQTGFMGAMTRFSDYAGFLTQGRNFRKPGIGRFSDNSLVAAEMYGAIDNYGRVRAFVINVLNGMQPEQAVGRVNRYMQRYGHGYLKKVPSFARGPLGAPAISFPLEYARIMKNVVLDHPGLYLGLYHALPLMNAASLAAANADPDYVAEMFQNQSGGFGKAGVFNGGLIVATGHNQFTYHQMEYLDPINAMRHPISNGPPPAGIADHINRGAENFARRMIGGNATVKAILYGIQGRDSRTGVRDTGKTQWQQVVDNFKKDFVPTIVPPYFPLAGKFSSDLIDSNNLKAGRKFTGRVTTVAERVFEEITGTKTEGLDAKMSAAVEPFLRWSLLLAGDPKGLARNIRHGGAYNENDFLRMVLLTSKIYDKPGTGTFIYKTDEDYRELQGAIEHTDRAREKRLIERIVAKQKFSGLLGGQLVEADVSQAELVQMLRGAYDPETIDEAYRGMNITRKMAALINVAVSGAPRETVRRVADLAMSMPSGRLFEGTTPAQMARVTTIVEAWLRQAPEGDGKDAVRDVWDYVSLYRADAQEELNEQIWTNQGAQEALKALRRAGVQPATGDFEVYYDE